MGCSGMRAKPSPCALSGHYVSPSADLRAPERGLVGGEVPIRGAEFALQLDRVTGGQDNHCLQPDCGGLGDMRSADVTSPLNVR